MSLGWLRGPTPYAHSSHDLREELGSSERACVARTVRNPGYFRPGVIDLSKQLCEHGTPVLTGI